MITLARAAADLIATPRPIRFLDTCALLDIVRAPLRDLTAAVRAGVELRALEATPGSVSLYGGEGQIAIGDDPAVILSVTFTNTPDEQRVRLMPMQKTERQEPAQSGFLVRASSP
jgi:hypothetical protein